MRAQVWVIRGGEENRLVDEFVDGGFTAVGYYSVGDGIGLTAPVLAVRLKAEGVADAPQSAARFRSFVHEIRVGDVVLMPDPRRAELVVGRVEGDYEFHHELEPEQYRHRRRVNWVGRHRYGDLPAGRDDIHRQRQTLRLVTDAADLVEHAEAVAAGRVGKPAADKGPVVASGRMPPERRSAPTGPRKAPEAKKVCPSCGYNWPLANFEGHDLCRDCR